MKRLLHEPLLHFVALGALLFAVYAVVDRDRVAASDTTIVMTPDELSRLALLFHGQWRRDPTPEEFGRLVENRVQEEVLYREGLAMGLDQGDTMIKRRLAQKVQFVAEDVAASHEPSAAELKAWFEKNAVRFQEPPRVSFRHLYFSPDRRGARARDDAADALSTLAGQPHDTKRSTRADPFMFHEYYRDRAPEYLGKEFGPPFARAVVRLPTGSWQGPIESGFGWHLVFVDTLVPGRVPAYEEVEDHVRTAWLGERKAMAWDKAYKEMRSKYTVVVLAPPDSKESARVADSSPGEKVQAPPATGAQ